MRGPDEPAAHPREMNQINNQIIHNQINCAPHLFPVMICDRRLTSVLWRVFGGTSNGDAGWPHFQKVEHTSKWIIFSPLLAFKGFNEGLGLHFHHFFLFISVEAWGSCHVTLRFLQDNYFFQSCISLLLQTLFENYSSDTRLGSTLNTRKTSFVAMETVR